MAYGPLEYYIIGFEGHKFTGDIAPALKKAADSGAIRILDLVFVTKDRSGRISTIEYEHFDDEVALAFSRIDKNGEGLFSGEDVEEIGKAIDNDSSAALILVEHVWAAELREATIRARGHLIQHGILTENAVEALDTITA
ncbi:MAG: DUF6325 family protein [Vulcanimicrobiaceae bacterium]